MKSIIKITLSIVVALSFFSLQSCKKDIEITPDKTPVINKSITGKWRAINGTKTVVHEFINGEDENHGSGSIQITTTNPANSVTVTTTPFKWSVSGNQLHLVSDFNMIFLFQISEDGSRLIIFSDKEMKTISSTSERIK